MSTYRDPIIEHFYRRAGDKEKFLRDNPPPDPIASSCQHERWVYGYAGETRRCSWCGKFERGEFRQVPA